jgi:nicotinamidase/pyrazinamidase
MQALGTIDVQNDFMLPTGALYVPGAEKIIPALQRNVMRAVTGNNIMFFTADSHDGTEPEMKDNGGPFPLHCIAGTDGAEIIKEMDPAILDKAAIFGKRCYNVFDSDFGSQNIRRWLDYQKISEVYLQGVVGNICVEAAALGLRNMGINVTLIEDAIVWLNVSDTNNETISRQKLKDSGVQFIPTLA